MTTYVYIDNSNFYVEGCRVSAVNKGMAKSIQHAHELEITDRDWHPDYGKLYDFLCGADSIARLWGSPPPGAAFGTCLIEKVSIRRSTSAASVEGKRRSTSQLRTA